jgi:hypothetical protein
MSSTQPARIKLESTKIKPCHAAGLLLCEDAF